MRNGKQTVNLDLAPPVSALSNENRILAVIPRKLLALRSVGVIPRIFAVIPRKIEPVGIRGVITINESENSLISPLFSGESQIG